MSGRVWCRYGGKGDDRQAWFVGFEGMDATVATSGWFDCGFGWSRSTRVLSYIVLERACTILVIRVFGPMFFWPIFDPLIKFRAVSEIANLDFVLSLSPPGIEDFVNDLVSFFCDVYRGICIHLFHDLIWCDGVEFASVEHGVDFPVFGQG